MMAQKHLHELLKEDQEPFQLKKYIEDRSYQLIRPKTTTLQSKKRKPIIDSTTTKLSLYKQACFFSFQDSPDVRKSPFPDFLSPVAAAKSPCKSPSRAVFVHIPAKTAALLLEAAMRIQNQKQKQSSTSKQKAQLKKFGFGLFGSFLHKLKDRNRSKKREIGGIGAGFLAEDDSFLARGKASSKKSQQRQDVEVVVDNKSGCEISSSCSCNNSRLSSAAWSDSIEKRSLDLDNSTASSRSENSEEETDNNANFSHYQKQFRSSPLSPFRFSLQRSRSTSGCRTPDFSSPASSPSHHKKQEEENYEVKSLNKIQQEDEEEKEQCSPVSVLEPPFEDYDEEGHEYREEEEEEEEEDDYDLECSYAVVQRVKHQLLQKLRRFEKMAELDPIELEKRMVEEQDGESGLEIEEYEDDEALSWSEEKEADDFVREVYTKSSLPCQLGKIPADTKKLLLDLIVEEKREKNVFEDKEVVMKRVCKRLDSWTEVESNTIDMMVELDFRRSELDGWKNYQQQLGEIAVEIELATFGLLVDELSEELVC